MANSSVIPPSSTTAAYIPFFFRYLAGSMSLHHLLPEALPHIATFSLFSLSGLSIFDKITNKFPFGFLGNFKQVNQTSFQVVFTLAVDMTMQVYDFIGGFPKPFTDGVGVGIHPFCGWHCRIVSVCCSPPSQFVKGFHHLLIPHPIGGFKPLLIRQSVFTQ